MTEGEEYFPRGKVTPAVAKANKLNNDVDEGQEKRHKRKSKEKLDNLFNDIEPVKREFKPKKGKKSKYALTAEEEKVLGKNRRNEEKRFAVVPLNLDQVVEGMLSLGIVSKVTDHEVIVTLPGRIIGVVSITNISTPYLNLLEEHAKGKGNKNQDIVLYTLKEMFHVGQTVLVKVKSVEKGEKVKITLSMNPKDIYANYSTTILQNDLVFAAAVVSAEDHGYVMDIGINGARCFLSKDDANNFIKAGNFNRKLGIGQLVLCKINNVNIHRLIADVKLTAFRRAVRSQKMDDIGGLNYSTLVPGMLVDAIVMETHKTGLMAHCLDLNGLVFQDHMKEEWVTPESIEIGSTIAARILYILPNLTSPYLTLQTDLEPLSCKPDQTNRDKLGSKEPVRVVRVEKRGIVVRIQDGNYKGLIPLSHLGDETLLSTEDISKKYKEHSIHDARILSFSPIERTYICSFKKELLEGDIVHMERVNSGEMVNCQILQWNKGGALVSYGVGMRAFIPNTLLRPDKLSDSAKEKLVGTTHKARIFSKEPEKARVLLTIRKEFVKSKGATIASIQDAQIGMTGHALIKSFNTVGAYVTILGGCEGFIPASKLSKEKVENFQQVFHAGQIVEFRVIDINDSKNHLVLSLILDEEPGEKKPKKDKKGKKRKLEESANNSSTVEGDSGEVKAKKRRRRRRSRKTKNSSPAPTGEVEQEVDVKIKVEDPDEEDGLKLPENMNFWETSMDTTVKDDSDDDSEEVVPKATKKKATLKVSVPLNMVNTSQENSVMQSTPNLELVERYEKGQINNPNDFKFWISIMTHYSSIGIVEKAREVAKHALEMINFREEKAKLKVWGALLKLEVKYGTEETVKSTMADALQRNDAFECLKTMALVYDDVDRFKDAEKTYRQIVKQFRLEPDAWIRFGTFYYQRKKFDSGRELLNESLSVLPFSKHVFVISKFALLEIHHGEKSRGESMFDHILAQNPQRADIWLVYIDALIKASLYDEARAVFVRAFDIKWHPKKVKPLLKRYQEFETAHGTQETMNDFHSVAMKVLNFSQE